jgi:hypothetical protein
MGFGGEKERRQPSNVESTTEVSPDGIGPRYNKRAVAASAQTGRRGEARPVSAMLRRRELTGRFVFCVKGSGSLP